MKNTQSPAPGVAIERFEPECDGDGARMNVYSNGDYVRYSDYIAALQASAAAEPDAKPWGEIRTDKYGELAIFTPDFNAKLAVFTNGASGNFSEGDKLYTAPPLPAQVQEAEPTPEMIAAFKDAFKEGSIWEDRITAGLRAALASRTPAPGMAGGVGAYACPKGCGCWWRDNQDGTMSLFNGEQRSCEVCESLPIAKLFPVSLRDNLFIDQRDDGIWLVCVEKVYDSREAAHLACRKWKMLETALSAAPHPSPAPQAAGAVANMRGLHVLRGAIAMLREEAVYRDDEGEDTDALEELLAAIEAGRAGS